MPLILGTLLVLSACVQSGDRDGAEPLPQSGNARVTERDVEAPEVFRASEKGLWDGRPSLGGVWVAHPDVTTPRRVLIRNTENGREIVGALFRRERANPGPRIQVSSDAAQRLGILAGQPTDLAVVALERAEAEAPAATEDGAAVPAGEAAPPAEGEGADVAATAAAAIAAADGAADGAAAPVAEPQPVPEDRPPTSFGRRNRSAPPPEPAPLPPPEPADGAPADPAADAAAAALAAPALEPQPVPEDRPPTSFGRRNRPRAADAAEAPVAAPGDVTVAPLDAPAPAGDGALAQPFLQAAVFSTEAAAREAASAIGAAGLAATVGEAASGSGTLWRVTVGPAATSAERDVMLERLKSLGYTDAYPVGG